MPKICFPHCTKGEYDSLDKAIKGLERESYSTARYALCEIVQYNTCYRNHLRRYGVEDLIVRLIEEAPRLKEEKVLLYRLRRWAAEEKIADYDIQCYNIKDKITILGHTFKGLKDIREHIEMFGREDADGLHCWSPAQAQMYEDVHIGHFYEYPIFDIDGFGYNRTYQNYIFRPTPVTEGNMKDALRTFHSICFCMVHENIMEEMLPILYYRSAGKYMLLASKREM